jgi:hypothetical protein
MTGVFKGIFGDKETSIAGFVLQKSMNVRSIASVVQLAEPESKEGAFLWATSALHHALLAFQTHLNFLTAHELLMCEVTHNIATAIVVIDQSANDAIKREMLAEDVKEKIIDSHVRAMSYATILAPHYGPDRAHSEAIAGLAAAYENRNQPKAG